LKNLMRSALFAVVLSGLSAVAQPSDMPKKPAPATPAASGKWTQKALKGDPIYATFDTNHGKFTVELFSKDAPNTVANFVGLAAGEKEWTDPRTNEKTKKKLYEGVIFHRVIDEFMMIQGGDPLGQGTGGPGYRFEDEFQSGKTFDHTGILAMANSGPNTNGSQFFITVDGERGPPVHLNNRHTIFGQVVTGYDVVQKIAKVETTPPLARPVKDVVINKISLTDKAPKGAKPAVYTPPKPAPGTEAAGEAKGMKK
jgi:peptidyl-prolyl cis-trans isomerase A (cyclophilin A)